MSDEMATTIERETAQRSARPSPVTPEQPVAPEKPGGRKRTVFIIMGVALLGLVAVGVRRWIYSLSHVSTDNAQVDGHIVPNLPKVGGYVIEVRTDENRSAKAGDTLVVLDDRDYTARLAQAEADLAVALAGVSNRARVSKKTVEVGQLVQPGQPLMSLVPLGDVWVTANLKETQTADVSPGDPADFTVDAYPGRHFSGHVESLSPATGAKFSLLPPDNATGNFT